MGTALTQRHHSRILSQEYFPRIRKWSLFGRITAEVCLLALRQPAKANITAVRNLTMKFNNFIKFSITMKIEALGSNHEDTKIPRYQIPRIG